MAKWKPSNPIRSRCPWCKEFATEGAEHRCSATGDTVTHENPATPKEDKRNGK